MIAHRNYVFVCTIVSYINVSTNGFSPLLPPAFNASDLPSIYASGCMEPEGCLNSTGSVLTAAYRIDMTCCSTDLCNGAASIRLPVTAALAAALVALWSTWGP